MASNKQAFGGNETMSFPKDRHRPVPDCRFNGHVIKADSWQMKHHIEEHDYEYLLQATKSLNLIEEYARQKREHLVEILTNNSLIRSESHVC